MWLKIWIVLNTLVGIWMCSIASVKWTGHDYGWCILFLILGTLNFNAAHVNYIQLKDIGNE